MKLLMKAYLLLKTLRRCTATNCENANFNIYEQDIFHAHLR